ncbi:MULTISPECIES: hypothetical protein [Vibrio]|uniref:hypothetical protein n=2 Tax=Vibrionaceae TaxID=641 RepID=UPI0015942553|nr:MULTISPECIES: hypothetical protein [Vibrio]MDF9401815.1 hypothetical protein [Vibrio sp. 1180_3]NGZ18906.1 hypothetical protein [Vibrio aestuarianus]
MDPQVIEYGINKELASVVSDMFKVGIPSVVAIVTSWFTYKAGKKNSELTRTIAEMNIESEANKLASERQYALILDISHDLTEIYEQTRAYHSVLLANIKLKLEGKEVSQELELKLYKNLSSQYETENSKMQFLLSKSYLIGDQELITLVDEFRELLITTMGKLHIDTGLSFDDAVYELMPLTGKRTKIYERLSHLSR